MDDFLHSLIFYFYVCTIIHRVSVVTEDHDPFQGHNQDPDSEVHEDLVEAEDMVEEESHKLWTTPNL